VLCRISFLKHKTNCIILALDLRKFINSAKRYGNIDALMNQSTNSVLWREQTSVGSRSTKGCETGNREAEQVGGILPKTMSSDCNWETIISKAVWAKERTAPDEA
jgi:hypothetical protein